MWMSEDEYLNSSLVTIPFIQSVAANSCYTYCQPWQYLPVWNNFFIIFFSFINIIDIFIYGSSLLNPSNFSWILSFFCFYDFDPKRIFQLVSFCYLLFFTLIFFNHYFHPKSLKIFFLNFFPPSVIPMEWFFCLSITPHAQQ